MTDVPQTTDLLAWVQQGGIVGVLLVVLVGGIRGWWVFGWVYRERIKELEADRDDWKQTAKDLGALGKHGTELAGNATSFAEKIASLVADIQRERDSRDSRERPPEPRRRPALPRQGGTDG